MNAENYPKFAPKDSVIPLEFRVAGLSTEELLSELKEIFSFFRHGSYGMQELILRNQILVLLEGRELADEVIDAACIMGTWEGDRISDVLYPPGGDDSGTE